MTDAERQEIVAFFKAKGVSVAMIDGVQVGPLWDDMPSPTAARSVKLGGPGTELKKLLAKAGISATAGCSCNQRALLMDVNGCDWVEANEATVVGWLREEATKRGLPFVDMAGRVLVRRAIRNARKAEARRAKEAQAEGEAAV